MTHANAARGEVVCRLGGDDRRLCLTLGALAEIEAAFGVEGIGELAERLRKLSARDLLAVLAALLRGGGDPDAADGLADSQVDLGEVARAVAQAFEAVSG